MIEESLQKVPEGELEGIDLKKIKIYKGEGCRTCGDTGYQGRIGIYEVVPLSPTIKTMIIERKEDSILEEIAIKEGMITMMQDGLIKALKGVTTIEEILRVTEE